jgi:hypothetical protein
VRIKVRNFMERGADIAWLSAFPAENEVVFAPLTYILPDPDGVNETIEGLQVIDCDVSS